MLNEQSEQLIGYSSRINDPAFAKFIADSKKWSMRFALLLAVVAIGGFFIYGATSRTMNNPEALFMGIGVGGIFMAIAVITNIGKKKSKTWDGIVVDKRTRFRTVKSKASDGTYNYSKYSEYTVVIKSVSGKLHKIVGKDNDRLYNYVNIGDHVRHHAGLNSFEKYDKSGDSIIYCNACGSLNNINDEYCHRCKCPLLK